MLIKEFNTDEFSSVYREHMVSDFPACELKPLENIIVSVNSGLCHCFGLYKNSKMVGYCILIIPKDGHYALIDYLAIIKEFRNMGYGHQFFESLKMFMDEFYPKIRGIYIESENISAAPDAGARKIRTRRIDFYKSCGCVETPALSELFGVLYSIFYFPVHPQFGDVDSDYLKNIDRIYQKMFKPHHYQSKVKLWSPLSSD